MKTKHLFTIIVLAGLWLVMQNVALALDFQLSQDTPTVVSNGTSELVGSFTLRTYHDPGYDSRYLHQIQFDARLEKKNGQTNDLTHRLKYIRIVAGTNTIAETKAYYWDPNGFFLPAANLPDDLVTIKVYAYLADDSIEKGDTFRLTLQSAVGMVDDLINHIAWTTEVEPNLQTGMIINEVNCYPAHLTVRVIYPGLEQTITPNNSFEWLRIELDAGNSGEDIRVRSIPLSFLASNVTTIQLKQFTLWYGPVAMTNTVNPEESGVQIFNLDNDGIVIAKGTFRHFSLRAVARQALSGGDYWWNIADMGDFYQGIVEADNNQPSQTFFAEDAGWHTKLWSILELQAKIERLIPVDYHWIEIWAKVANPWLDYSLEVSSDLANWSEDTFWDYVHYEGQADDEIVIITRKPDLNRGFFRIVTLH